MFFCGFFFKKSVKTAVLDDGRPPRALVLSKLIEWYRFEVGDDKGFFCDFCDLQKSRHLQKKSRHGAAQSGHKAKIEVAPGAKKAFVLYVVLFIMEA